MSVVATVDVGSNSVLCCVASGGQVLSDRAVLSRLGEGLRDTGAFSVEAMDRTAAALAELVGEARELGATEIAAVGTMALRNASNAEAFLARIQREVGLEVEVIPGSEEARLSYQAVRSGLSAAARRVVVFDVGGGSTEFIHGQDGAIERAFSLNVGALRLTEEYLGGPRAEPPRDEGGGVTPVELDALMAALDQELAEVVPVEGLDAVVGMGGAITNLVAIHLQMASYDPSRVQGARLDLPTLDALIKRLRSLPVAQRRDLPGLQPKRADTILAGAAVVRTVLARLEVDHAVVSVRGIRHGLLLDRFGVRV